VGGLPALLSRVRDGGGVADGTGRRHLVERGARHEGLLLVGDPDCGYAGVDSAGRYTPWSTTGEVKAVYVRRRPRGCCARGCEEDRR
jgi:hypothetical protein